MMDNLLEVCMNVHSGVERSELLFKSPVKATHLCRSCHFFLCVFLIIVVLQRLKWVEGYIKETTLPLMVLFSKEDSCTVSVMEAEKCVSVQLIHRLRSIPLRNFIGTTSYIQPPQH